MWQLGLGLVFSLLFIVYLFGYLANKDEYERAIKHYPWL